MPFNDDDEFGMTESEYQQLLADLDLAGSSFTGEVYDGTPKNWVESDDDAMLTIAAAGGKRRWQQNRAIFSAGMQVLHDSFRVSEDLPAYRQSSNCFYRSTRPCFTERAAVDLCDDLFPIIAATWADVYQYRKFANNAGIIAMRYDGELRIYFEIYSSVMYLREFRWGRSSKFPFGASVLTDSACVCTTVTDIMASNELTVSLVAHGLYYMLEQQAFQRCTGSADISSWATHHVNKWHNEQKEIDRRKQAEAVKAEAAIKFKKAFQPKRRKIRIIGDDDGE